MKTDLLLVPMGATWAELRAAAVTAEEAGFDGLWTWDHLRDPDGGADSPVPEVWTVLSALAEATRATRLVGADGGCEVVVTSTVLDGSETPPALKARTR